MSRAVRQMSSGCPVTISMHTRETTHGNFWKRAGFVSLVRMEEEQLGDSKLSKEEGAKLDHITIQTYSHANVSVGMDGNTDIQ